MVNSIVPIVLLLLCSVGYAFEAGRLPSHRQQSNVSLSDTLPSELEQLPYGGAYRSCQTTKQFNFLDSQEGSIHMLLFSPMDVDGSQMIQLALYDPIYHDLNAVALQFDVPTNTSENEWDIDDRSVDVFQFYHEQLQKNVSCKSRIHIKLSYQGTSGSNLWQKVRIYLEMEGSSTGADPLCSFWFTSDLTYYSKSGQILGYCVFVSSLLIVQLILNACMFRQIQFGRLDLGKLSLATVTFCTSQDLYYILRFVVHLMNEMTDARFIYFSPIFLLLIQLVLFDIRLVVLMWRQRNTGVPPRNALLALYVVFYLTILVYVTTMFLFPFQVGLILLQAFTYAPQILHNIRAGNNPGFSWLYVLGFLTLRRFFVPLYEHGCPSNLFKIHPDTLFIVMWILLYLVQICFLFIQAKKGARFFVPKRCIPGYYEYNFKYKVDFHDVLDCPICLQPMYLNPDENGSFSQDSVSTLGQSLVIENIVAKAPCKHMYHWSCFRTWIDVKMECPVCRARLPALLD